MLLSRSNQKREICVETLPLPGIARPQNMIKRRDAVRGYKQQILADRIKIANLSASEKWQRSENWVCSSVATVRPSVSCVCFPIVW